MNIYSIKNEKLGFFNRPIYCESSAEALSYIQNILMSDADRALKGLRGDLALYLLGEIDFTTGDIFTSDFSGYEGTACPAYICSLDDIFDSIPEEKVPRPIQKDDLERLYKRMSDLASELDSLKNHSHTNKGRSIPIYDHT